MKYAQVSKKLNVLNAPVGFSTKCVKEYHSNMKPDENCVLQIYQVLFHKKILIKSI